MKHVFNTLIVLALLPCLAAAQPQFQLGVNLVNDGAFVNIANHTARYSQASGYDSFGWPMSDFQLVLMDGRPVAEWTNQIDDPEQYRVDYSGTYQCSFRGAGDVQASGTAVAIQNLSYDAQSNLTTFELTVGGFPGPNHGLVFLQFSNTQRTPSSPMNSGITELKVHRPGYPLSSTKTFTDEYIALCQAADFSCYRFYNVQNIWSGEPIYPAKTTWENRKTPLDAAQVSLAGTSGKLDGWCWEYIVEISNILKKDIWVCIPISCDEDYVKNLAQYLMDELDPSINIYVESSNEVWSPTHMTHGAYNQADAQARGITFDQNHARRTVELSNWFADVWGSDAINNRIRVIMAGQHAYHGRSDNHLNYINTTFGPPKNYIYATSSALYFGSEQAASTVPETVAVGMLQDINNQINDDQLSTYRLNHIDKAEMWDLPGGCTSYEGGPHLPAGGGTDNLDAQIQAHRTQEMLNVLKRNYLEGWNDLGGGLAMYFTIASGYNRYGCWGLTDDYTNPDRNFKMQAVREIIARTTTGIESPGNATSHAIEIAPNPFRVSITLRSELPANVRIADVLGRTVWEGRAEGVRTISTAEWRPGVYMIISNGQVQKVVKR
ncbi:MAG: hypothetical protein CL946_10760 [Ectothiorhodospiraceae bacterium]|nr:hypothetical protein [Ectothiorhodospiraceae bacterium]